MTAGALVAASRLLAADAPSPLADAGILGTEITSTAHDSGAVAPGTGFVGGPGGGGGGGPAGGGGEA